MRWPLLRFTLFFFNGQLYSIIRMNHNSLSQLPAEKHR